MSGVRWTTEQYEELSRRRLAPSAPAKAEPKEKRAYKSKAEARYADILESQKRAQLIRDWRYEGVTLRLADGVRYTPDFLVVERDFRMTLIEVKGHMREAARVRLKIAVEMFPAFGWYLIWAKRSGFEPVKMA